MADENNPQDAPAPAPADDTPAPPGPATHIAPSPHVGDTSRSTRWMMIDVLIALVPLMIVAIWVFGLDALRVAGLCVAGCLATEAAFAAARRKPFSLCDYSAIVTGIILAMSLPWNCPWYVAVVGAAAAVALGKMIFGGLGQNLFNPAMVGRAFVMICFAGALAGPAFVDEDRADISAVTGATPMSAFKQAAKDAKAKQAHGPHDAEEGDESEQAAEAPPAKASSVAMFLGNTNGSLGETSALACILGGAYLLIRRTAASQIPLGVVLAVVFIGSIAQLAGAQMTMVHHVLGGALLFGALFIATDPVSSPLTPLGRFVFGVGIGGFVMLLRLASSYPEGVMFAVLLMNAVVPLINRWTVPTPVGGPVPQKA